MIDVRNLTKDYSGCLALDGITFRVSRGSFFGCFGPNGAGKSTLIKVLTGAVEPKSGTCFVTGKDVKLESVKIRQNIGIVPESESPPSFLTVREFLEFVAELHGCSEIDRKVKHWLAYFDLKDKQDTLCKDLSKGMRQKIMISSAFIHEPDLLFLDEPFLNLDPIYQARLREFLKDYVKQGKTVFMCSHILEIAQKLCDRIMILNKGKLLGIGTLDELRNKSDESLEQVFMRMVGKAGADMGELAGLAT